MLHYRVYSLKDLRLIIDHFEKYPIIYDKWVDFELWKQVYYLMLRGEHLTHAGLQKFVAIKAAMNQGLSEELP